MTSDNLPTFELGEYRIRLLKYRDKYALEHTHRGARKRISLRTSDYQEALDEFFRAKLSIQDAGHDKDIYHSDLLAHCEYYLWFAQSRVTKGTYKLYVYHLGLFREFVIAERVNDLNPEMHEKLKHYLLGRSFSKRTVNMNIRVVNQVINFIVKHKRISSDRYDNISYIPDKSAKLPLILIDDEIQRLLNAVKRRRVLYDLVLFALNTGMRKKEIVNLLWDDVDFERELIHIQSHPEHDYHPKTYEYRYLKMNTTIREILARQPKYPGIPYVFTSTYGTSVNWVMHSKMKRYLKGQGFKQNNPWHTLRRTFASRAVAQGVHPAVLKEMMGHSSIDTTMRYYIHVMEDSIGDAMHTIEYAQPHTKDEVAAIIPFPRGRPKGRK